MSKPNRNDISIGKDKWITFIELDGGQSSAIELDEILKPIEPFVTSLETECVAACCGIGAYALWPEDIATAAKHTDRAELRRCLDAVQTHIAKTNGDTFVSQRMNNFFHRATLLELFNHIGYWIEHADDVGEQSHAPEPAAGPVSNRKSSPPAR